MLKVEFPLRDGLVGDDMSGEMLLDGFGGTDLYYVRCQPAVARIVTIARIGVAYSHSYEDGEHRWKPCL